MKKSVFQISGLAACAIFLFSCASSGKVSKQSFGGNWNETVAAKSNTPAEVATPVTPVFTPAAKEVAPVSTEVAVQENQPAAVAVKTAKKQMAQTANFSVKEKVAQKAAAKKMAKLMKKQPNTVDNKLVLVIIALFLPWLAVLLYKGVGTEFWISLLLWLLFILPGFIYALLVIFDVI
jgi:uncharacterized membrane protein YqaE (UPF0057 family)